MSSKRINLIHSYCLDVISQNQTHYTTCSLAKQKRLQLQSSMTSTNVVFDLIHTNIWGPYSQASLNGHHYFLTIVDDHSRTTWVYLIKFKSEAKSILQSFILMIHTQFESKIKQIKSDNGLEFHMPEFYKSHGIIHQKSCVYTPQQNGVVEQKQQHLITVARALLLQASLPKKFWGDVVLTAAHLIYRIPSPLLDNQSPYEVLFSSKPSYLHLRVFGCLYFMFTLKRDRTKLDHRSNKCIFIGYLVGIKGYKVYDLTNYTTLVARDIIFIEFEFPFKYSTSKNNSSPTLNPDLTLPPPFPDILPYPYSSPLNKPEIHSPSTDPFSSPSPSAPDLTTLETESIIPSNHVEIETATSLLPAPPRSSNRVKHTPSYLHDYHCQLVSSSNHPSLSTDCTAHPLHHTLSYSWLSHSHQT